MIMLEEKTKELYDAPQIPQPFSEEPEPTHLLFDRGKAGGHH